MTEITMRHGSGVALAALLAVTMASVPAPGAAEGLCTEAEQINRELQYLRRLSLDLRGKLPSADEYQQVVEDKLVSDETIRTWIGSQDFNHQMRQYHRELLTASLANLRLAGNNRILSRRNFASGDPVYFIANGNVRIRKRGSNANVEGVGFCADQQVTLRNPVATTQVIGGETFPVDGWVEVRPWWDRSTTIKVCAFDAIPDGAYDKATYDDILYRDAGGNDYGGYFDLRDGFDCRLTTNHRACGCGPNLERCMDNTARTLLRTSFVDQVLAFTDTLTDRPYTDIILGRDIYFNGPLSSWTEHLSYQGGTLLVSDRDPGYTVPAVRSDMRSMWSQTERPEHHAGVLTMPYFMLKWQSDRARANAFYSIFMCNSFTPPTDGLPGADHPSVNEPNLTHRDGCDFCHRSLEPMAAYWGHWAEAGYLELGREIPNNVRYTNLTPFNEACQVESCNNADWWRCAPGPDRTTCRFFYQTNPVGEQGDQYKGVLKGYVFADVDVNAETNDRDCDWTQDGCGYTENLRKGPRDLAQQIIDSGEFSSCATRRVWGKFIGRDMTREERLEQLPGLAAGFTGDAYDLKKLVFTMVTRPEYRDATWSGLKR